MNPTVVVIFSTLLLAVSALFAQTPPTPQALPPHTIVIKPGLPVPERNVPAAALQKPALIFDADSKEYNAKPGESIAPFSFSITNVSEQEVVINNVTTSCGCTVAKLPSQPWHLAPGADGEIKVTVNLAGKMGHVTKQVTVNSSAGIKALLVNVNIPPMQSHVAENARGDRNKNMELAKADRQAVFKGDCRSCHVDKGSGKTGRELYVADCGICHDSPIRAAMVPDLRAPKGRRDRDFWVNWITHGRVASMMPAFGEKEGGPLSQAQIDSLVSYMIENFPQGVAPAPAGLKAPIPPKVGGTQ